MIFGDWMTGMEVLTLLSVTSKYRIIVERFKSL